MVSVWFGLRWLDSPGQPSGMTFVISQGESTGQIVTRLKQEGFIRSQWLFRQTLKDSGLADRIQPGQHDLADVSDYGELIERLTKSQVAAHELVLKVIEGWNLNDIQAELKKQGYPRADDFDMAAGQPISGFRIFSHIVPDWQSEYEWLSGLERGDGLEGYLFPDTYRVYRDATPEEVVRRLLDNFERRLERAGLFDKVKASGHSLHEIVTMASILEREVRGKEDRQMVADLFWRRLEEGMALQADSTVNYVTGKSTAAASAEDLKIDSAYNTYRYRGLPPGPIGNPGLEALEAALNPTANDYWFFLTDSEGAVHYAKNFDQHKRNKALYLR
jgi:UPF0755 protein